MTAETMADQVRRIYDAAKLDYDEATELADALGVTADVEAVAYLAMHLADARAAERARCAKVCEEIAAHYVAAGHGGNRVSENMSRGAKLCALRLSPQVSNAERPER